MKKTRVLSLIMSAILTTTVVPIGVYADSNAEVPFDTPLGVELIDGGNWQGIGGTVDATPNVTAENHYLYVHNRDRADNLFQVNLTSLKEILGERVNDSTEYNTRVSFKVRTQSGDYDTYLRILNAGHGVISNVQITAGVHNAWQTVSFDLATGTSDAGLVFYIRGRYDYYSTAPFMIDDVKLEYKASTESEWQTAKVLDFEGLTTGIDVTDGIPCFNLKTSANGTSKYRIEAEPASYTFAGAADASNQNRLAQLAKEHSAQYKVDGGIKLEPGVYSLSGDAKMLYYYLSPDHNQAAYTAEGDKGLKITDDGTYVGYMDGLQKLEKDTPYHLYYKLSGNEGNDGNPTTLIIDKKDLNYRGVNICLNGAVDGNVEAINGTLKDGDSLILKSLTVDGKWSSFTTTFEVPAGEYVTLDSISFDGTGKAYDVDPLVLSNVSLKQLDSFAVSDSDDKNVAVLDIIDAHVTSSGTEPVIGVGEQFAPGNNYLAISGRINNAVGIKVTPKDQALVVDGNYLVFDIRASVPVMNGSDASVANMRFYYDEFGGRWNEDGGAKIEIFSTEWKEIRVPCSQMPNGYIELEGGGGFNNGGAGTAPYEIDNVRISKFNGDTEVVLSTATDTFDKYKYVSGSYNSDGKYSCTAAEYTLTYGDYKPSICKYFDSPKLVVETEGIFYTTKFSGANGALAYNFGANYTLEPGIYKFTCKMSNGEYQLPAKWLNDTTDPAAANVFDPAGYNFANRRTENYVVLREDGNANYNQLLISDNNGFKITPKFTFTKPADADSYKVVRTSYCPEIGTGWTEFEYVFAVYKATDVTELRIDIAHYFADATQTVVNFKDLSIEMKELKEGGAMNANLGIIMLLLKKRQSATENPQAPTENVDPKNLIANGDLSIAPAVISGWDANAKQTWCEMDGEDSERADDGSAIPNTKIFRDQKITWDKNGYLVATGKSFNLTPSLFNTGLTLEPGNYVFKIDAMAANKGETTSLRALVVSTATPVEYSAPKAIDKTQTPVDVNSSEWSTITYEFTITTPTEVSIAVYGGWGAEYFQDYKLDNLYLEKLS